MAQVSRPFQIVLVVVLAVIALAAAVWSFALRGHSSSEPTTASTPSAAVPASRPATPAGGVKTPEVGKVYHGAAPGVEGLTRDVAKARGAVAEAQHSGEHELQKAGAAPSGAASTTPSATSRSTTGRQAAPSSTGAAASHSAGSATAHAGSGATAKTAPTTTPSSHSGASGAQSATNGVPAKQALVEHALKEGKVAVILFWNPKGADDVSDQVELRLLEAIHHLIPGIEQREPAVRAELKRSGLELEKKFAAFEASASQVTQFGSITRGVQVYGTPTLLVVNPKGQVVTITGLTDAYAIEQAIDEARHA
jgi:hypothetical protein